MGAVDELPPFSFMELLFQSLHAVSTFHQDIEGKAAKLHFESPDVPFLLSNFHSNIEVIKLVPGAVLEVWFLLPNSYFQSR